MRKRLLRLALFGTITVAAGCGSSHEASGMGGSGGTGGTAGVGGTGGTGGMGGGADAGLIPTMLPPCVSGGNAPCQPSDFPFVHGALAYSASCLGPCPAVSPPGPWTILLSQPQPGTLCLSGTNPAQVTGLQLILTARSRIAPDQFRILERFNADLLGITQVRFTIDRPPSACVRVGADTVNSDVCNGVDCITFGFRAANRVTTSGSATVALVDFVADPPQPFDTRALDAIWFDAQPGDFDFCVHDFQFLDANGVEVIPAP